ncbi:unnamed protein product [Prorocentrum cordatum]|uniref:Fe2OG dioxygenase domain-containing protein n=1 Tax=Prorocentrum cordatum TaxID=2364126 RepID=A0ABN9XVN9_9DINO|nr:unnamed protein product [Polarella glacialis]
MTPLHRAVTAGASRVFEFLLDQKVDPSAREAQGRNVLDLAKDQSDASARRALLQLLEHPGQADGRGDAEQAMGSELRRRPKKDPAADLKVKFAHNAAATFWFVSVSLASFQYLTDIRDASWSAAPYVVRGPAAGPARQRVGAASAARVSLGPVRPSGGGEAEETAPPEGHTPGMGGANGSGSAARAVGEADAAAGQAAEPAPLVLSGSGARPGEHESATARKYRPLQKHPALFDTESGWQEDWFDADFLAAMRADTDEAWSSAVEEHLPGALFSCRMFSKKFCDMLIEEVDNFAATGLPARRPNSMNNYGIILNEIGWKPMVNVLQDNILARIAARYWPHIAPFDGHHTFIVRYKENEDRGLDMHTDDSDVTFNLCLGREFSGAGLSFCGVMGQPDHRRHSFTYKHNIGRCCWHLGRQRHGADDITAGERLNLIVWNHTPRTARPRNTSLLPTRRRRGLPTRCA